ncbi:hypothetical protein DFH07DRAFT_784640 [Mycena maculata]|uniref:Uncharacterized protein n=1 Tax=Mycena maculata TaxID=230809 RepID=A0AAD7MIR3_9AGAR|nr:hypothetical protein DFH07DRAFT_784640 [Mycena maculata]
MLSSHFFPKFLSPISPCLLLVESAGTPMPNSVLRVQELCDHIAGHLREWPTDLRSSALVCPTLTSSVQHLLFRDIIPPSACRKFDTHFYDSNSSNDGIRACKRFCDILTASPHFVPLDIFLHGTGYLWRDWQTSVDGRSSGTVTEFLKLPSIQHIGLISMDFNDMDFLAMIFEHCMPQLESLLIHNVNVAPPSHRPAVIKHLCVSGQGDWLIHPLCPFDLSHLQTVGSGLQLEYRVVLRSRRCTPENCLVQYQVAEISSWQANHPRPIIRFSPEVEVQGFQCNPWFAIVVLVTFCGRSLGGGGSKFMWFVIEVKLYRALWML